MEERYSISTGTCSGDVETVVLDWESICAGLYSQVSPIRIKANLLPEGCKKYAVPELPCVEQKAEVKRKLPRSWMDMKY